MQGKPTDTHTRDTLPQEIELSPRDIVKYSHRNRAASPRGISYRYTVKLRSQVEKDDHIGKPQNRHPRVLLRLVL